jgi:hypothetical protein
MFTLFDFGSFLKVPRIVRKSLPHPVGVLSMLPNPAKCHIRQTSTTKWTIKEQNLRYLRVPSGNVPHDICWDMGDR